MTVHTVVEYFLKAGASYRDDIDWQRIYDSEGSGSGLLRTGKFGIGVFAAFLLGDELEVETRHVTQPEGIAFQARLDDQQIQLLRQSMEIGTTIEVRVPPRRFFELMNGRHFWCDTYLLGSPSVRMTVRLRGLVRFGSDAAPEYGLEFRELEET